MVRNRNRAIKSFPPRLSTLFWQNPSINPRSRRRIAYYGPAFLQLCDHYGSPPADGLDLRKHRLVSILEGVVNDNTPTRFTSPYGREFVYRLDVFRLVLFCGNPLHHVLIDVQQISYNSCAEFFLRLHTAIRMHDTTTVDSQSLSYADLVDMRQVMTELFAALGPIGGDSALNRTDWAGLDADPTEEEYQSWSVDCINEHNERAKSTTLMGRMLAEVLRQERRVRK